MGSPAGAELSPFDTGVFLLARGTECCPFCSGFETELSPFDTGFFETRGTECSPFSSGFGTELSPVKDFARPVHAPEKCVGADLYYRCSPGARPSIEDFRFRMLSGSSGGYPAWSLHGVAADCRVCTRPPLLANTGLWSDRRVRRTGLVSGFRSPNSGGYRERSLHEGAADCCRCTRPPF